LNISEESQSIGLFKPDVLTSLGEIFRLFLLNVQAKNFKKKSVPGKNFSPKRRPFCPRVNKAFVVFFCVYNLEKPSKKKKEGRRRKRERSALVSS
jgi:hypothetical protein